MKASRFLFKLQIEALSSGLLSTTDAQPTKKAPMSLHVTMYVQTPSHLSFAFDTCFCDLARSANFNMVYIFENRKPHTTHQQRPGTPRNISGQAPGSNLT